MKFKPLADRLKRVIAEAECAFVDPEEYYNSTTHEEFIAIQKEYLGELYKERTPDEWREVFARRREENEDMNIFLYELNNVVEDADSKTEVIEGLISVLNLFSSRVDW